MKKRIRERWSANKKKKKKEKNWRNKEEAHRGKTSKRIAFWNFQSQARLCRYFCFFFPWNATFNIKVVLLLNFVVVVVVILAVFLSSAHDFSCATKTTTTLRTAMDTRSSTCRRKWKTKTRKLMQLWWTTLAKIHTHTHTHTRSLARSLVLARVCLCVFVFGGWWAFCSLVDGDPASSPWRRRLTPVFRLVHDNSSLSFKCAIYQVKMTMTMTTTTATTTDAAATTIQSWQQTTSHWAKKNCTALICAHFLTHECVKVSNNNAA